MKKFSNITGEKVLSQKEINVEYTEEDIIKSTIMSLMDNHLSIQMYGPINKTHIAGDAKIAGKEIFLEALINMISSITTKEKIKNLKESTKEIKSINEGIYKLRSELNLYDEKILIAKNKILSLYERYKYDENILLNQFDKSIKKINNKEKIKHFLTSTDILLKESRYPNKLLISIKNKYYDKYQKLNYEIQ